MPCDAVLCAAGLDGKRGAVPRAGRAYARRRRRASPVAPRSLRIRRAGVWRDSVSPIFPSYVFLRASDVDPGLYAALRRTAGFVRFLPSNEALAPLEQRRPGAPVPFPFVRGDRAEVRGHFRREQAHPGHLGSPKNLDGLIVRVDRRKGQGPGQAGDVRRLLRSGFRV